MKIPSLTQIRRHIRKNAWNGRDFTSGDSNREVFTGMCEYASTALSEMLTGTGFENGDCDWSLRIRGWYKGDISALLTHPHADQSQVAQGKYMHSWVVYEGKIIDPTWWQFTDSKPGVYVFDLNDPRFEPDPSA